MIYTQCIRSLTMNYALIIAGKVSLKIEPDKFQSYASNFRLASKRLRVVQTEFGQNIGFSMRTPFHCIRISSNGRAAANN